MSVLTGVVGLVSAWVLARFVRRPDRWLLGLGWGFVAVSTLGPFTMGVGAVTQWTLAVMHVVSGAAVLTPAARGLRG